MKAIRIFAVAAGVTLAGAALAHAESSMTGKWTYQVGAATPCTLTFTAGADQTTGDAAAGAGCADGLSAVAHWRQVGASLNLISPSGDLVAVLRAKGDGYTGQQIGGGRKIALSR